MIKDNFLGRVKLRSGLQSDDFWTGRGTESENFRGVKRIKALE